MRVAVLGGTRFIGFALTTELAARGHHVAVVHRGTTEPADLPDVEHVHVDRSDAGALAAGLEAFGPDAVVDCLAMTAAGADTALAAMPASVARRVVLSSMDVYRAYGLLHAGEEGEALPLDETAAVREHRYPYRGRMRGGDDYEKLDVEERYLAAGGTVLRLPIVYGPRDGQRREEPVLRRVRAGRRRIPVGTGTQLFTRGAVGDVARGVALAVEAPAAVVAGEVFNLGEPRTRAIAGWFAQILAAAGSDAELVRVPDEALPGDLDMSAAVAQHLLVDSSKARRVLGWECAPAEESVRLSVEWHLANPPEGEESGFDEDERALAAAGTGPSGA